MSAMFNDINLLYRLSLSIGRTTSVKVNCENFINTILGGTPFDLGVVWANDDVVSRSEKLHSQKVVFSSDTDMVSYKMSFDVTLLPAQLKVVGYGVVDQPLKDSMKLQVGEGTSYIFRLHTIGHLFLHSTKNTHVSPEDYSNLQEVLQNFAVTIEGNLFKDAALYESYERIRTESLLIDKEILYQSVIESMSEGLIICDDKNTIQYFNPNVRVLLGYETEELIAHDIAELLCLNEIQETSLITNTEQGKSVAFEIPIPRNDKTIIWGYVKVAPYKNAPGSIIGLIITIDDVTDRKIGVDKVKSLAAFPNENPYPVIRLDLNLEVIYLNKACIDLCDILGVRKDEFLPDSLSKNITDVEGKIKFENRGRYFEFTYRKVRDEYYNLYGIDVTDESLYKNKLQRSEEKYRSILENMDLGLMEVDNNNVILKPYRTFCDMVEYSEEELVGVDAIRLLIKDKSSISLVKSQTRDRQKGLSGVYELKLYTKSGKEKWVLTSGTPIYNEKQEVVGSIGIHYDITGRKQMETRLIESMKKEKVLSQAKELFLANMSHEIRTPMNAILGMSHLLNRTNLDRSQREYLEAIRSSGEGLLAIINDILDVSKIEEGKIELVNDDFQLLPFLEDLIKIMSFKTEEKGIRLVHEFVEIENLVLHSDASRLKQILINLLNNAIKFTDKGHVGMSVCAENREGYSTVFFEVSDTGIGIKRKNIKSVFNRFEQANSSVSKFFGGTGLGLTIVKKLVELFGGTVKLRTKYGIGSSFSFEIELKHGNAKNVIKKGDAVLDFKEASKLKILMAEDNEYNQLLAQGIFKDNGLNLTVVENGKLAVEALREEQFDIVLMDVRMPVMNGMEATSIIRNDLNCDVPILALTANAIKGDREKYLSYGMSDYLSKPYNTNDLFGKIAHLTNIELVEVKSESYEKIKVRKLEEQKLYSLDKINSIFNDNSRAIQKMVNKFVTYVPEVMKEWDEAYHSNDYKLVGEVAHKLLGSVRTFEIFNVCDQLKEIELKCDKNENMEDIPRLYEHCKANLKKGVDQMKIDLVD